jgi:hypothetical protein
VRIARNQALFCREEYSRLRVEMKEKGNPSRVMLAIFGRGKTTRVGVTLEWGGD